MIGRLKFELDALVIEMLEQIPTSVFESATTTFFDPAMGGGQFLKQVEQRLTKYGHSKENIAGRLFGMESRQSRINFVKRKVKLNGTFWKGGIAELEELDMKFDVVLGNPPYTISKGRTPIYDKFLIDAVRLGDYVLMIVPASWIQQDTSHFKTLKTVIAKSPLSKIIVNPIDTFVDEKGNGAKVQTVTVVINKDAEQNKCVLIDKTTHEHRTITDITQPQLLIYSQTTLNILKKLYTKNNWKKKQPGMKTFVNSAYHIGTSYRCEGYEIAAMRDFKVIERDNTSIAGYVLLETANTKEEAERLCDNMNSYWRSELITWALQQTRYSTTLDGPQMRYVPVVSTDRKWTDEEIYKHFDFTQEEIDHVKSTIK